uniref:Leucine-rich repeat-containing N-terminal plant-type domain-containing protein n=1 Tax=Kalanchoe fedtschenkoi TaxID=63787 RepID=A0A7N0ZZD5_KALFE
MMRNSSAPNGYSNLVLFFLHISFLCMHPSESVIEDDERCLRGIKESLQDPQGKLDWWTNPNCSADYTCSFAGVRWWDETERRVLGLNLSGFELSGTLPDSLKYCGSLVDLDLSNNQLFGSITDICSWLPYLVYIDLSNNLFSGSIPPQIVNCNYLNGLMLANNRLSGNIPDQISSMGSIPVMTNVFGTEAYEGNNGLCGLPLEECGGEEFCHKYCCWCFWCGYGVVLWIWVVVAVLRGIWYGEVRRAWCW